MNEWLRSFFEASNAIPFVAGSVFGAGLTLFIGYKIAGYFGLNEYKEVANERKAEIASLKEQIEDLKRQCKEKDNRIDILHKESKTKRQVRN